MNYLTSSGFRNTMYLALFFILLCSSGAYASIDDVKVIKNGEFFITYPVEITPDMDGVDDQLQFSFQAGGNHSYAIVVDTNGNGIANPVIDWSQQDGKDWTFRDYVPSGDTRFIQWEGRDSMWKVLPNGTYQVWIFEDTLDNNFTSGVTANYDITVTVTTKYITGTVTSEGTGIEGARVNAGGPDGCGQAYTNSSGVYVISGLKAGTYHVNAEKDGYYCSNDPANNTDIVLSGTSVTKNLVMEPSVQVPLAITLPSAFSLPEGQSGSLWLNIDARNTLGAGWAHSQGSIDNGASGTTVNLNLQSLAAGQNWSVRVTGEFWFWYDPDGPGPEPGQERRFSYAGNASFTLASVTESGSVAIALTKACAVSGSVALSVAASSNLNINVRLQNVSDPSIEAWGWGQVQSGQSTGSFYIPSVANGTYRAIVQVEGFKSTTSDEFTVASSDVSLTQIEMDAGLAIRGTVHLGRTYDAPKTLWINAWAQNDFNCHNAQVTISAGSTDASFTISGLESLSYEIWTFMEGAEFTVNGGRPWENRIPAGATGVTLALTPYSGSISGTVTAPAGVTLSYVVISAQSLWGGTNGNTSTSFAANADGSYSVDYLSTGEYLIVANEFLDPTGSPLIPSGNTALFSQSIFVKNGEATGLTINLSSPYYVTGTVSGDSGILSENLIAVALPMNIAMKGGANMDGGMIMAPVHPSLHNYQLALGEGTYAITIIGFNNSGDRIGFACDRITKVVNSNMTGVNFTVSYGYTANITVNLPAAIELEEGRQMDFLGGLELYRGETKAGGDCKQVQIYPDGGTPPSGMNNASFVEAGSTSFSLAFEHLAPGNYTARFFSPWYVMGSKSFTVSDTDVNTSMTLSTGATITGRIVDAESGNPIYQNVVVSCEAIPWVDGSYRSTLWDPNGAFSSSTKKFQLRNLPEGTYIVNVSYTGSSTSNINYADASIFGVSISGTDSFDLGTIKLNQGTTISGQVTSGGTGIPNMLVVAEPMDSKYGKASAEAKTDKDGYYTISGIDPEKPYWKVIAAVRPEAWDMMAQQPDYGEEVKNNVAPGAESVNFALSPANATLSGTITIPEGKSFSPPFSMGDYSMPSALILLQKKGRVYAEPMDGLQVMSNPSDGTEATYNVTHLTPGTYRMMVVSSGVSTYVNPTLLIAEGSNTLNIELPAGATVSGSVTKTDGSFPTTNDLDIPVAMNLLNGELVFGTFTKDSGTGQISAYSISGLKPDYEYRVALVAPGAKGPGTIYVQTPGVTATSATDALSLNAVMAESEPTFMLAAARIGLDVNISIFSTTHLRDTSASEMISLTEGTGSLSNLMLNGDRTLLSFTYTPSTGESEFGFSVVAHYGADYTQVSQPYTIDLGVLSANQGLVNTFMGGNVSLGEGDASGVYFEPGDIDDANGDEESVVDVTKSDVGAVGDESVKFSFASLFGYANLLGPMAMGSENIIRPEVSTDLPATATARSKQYDFSIGADSIASGQTVTVTLQYDEGTDTTRLKVYHYTGGAWVEENTGRFVDTVNRTISAEVTSLSPFVAAEDSSIPSGSLPGTGGTTDTPTDSSGGGGGGGCFIGTADSGNLLGLMLFIGLMTLIALPRVSVRKS